MASPPAQRVSLSLEFVTLGSMHRYSFLNLKFRTHVRHAPSALQFNPLSSSAADRSLSWCLCQETPRVRRASNTRFAMDARRHRPSQILTPRSCAASAAQLPRARRRRAARGCEVAALPGKDRGHSGFQRAATRRRDAQSERLGFDTDSCAGKSFAT